MENKIFVNSEGKYLGEFSPVKKISINKKTQQEKVEFFDNPAIPKDAIEVFTRPNHGWDIYDFKLNSWKKVTTQEAPKKPSLLHKQGKRKRVKKDDKLEQ